MRTSHRPAGRGFNQLGQAIEDLINRSVRNIRVSVEYATVINDGVIKLDTDGYELYAEDNDFIILSRMPFVIGDRVLVVPIGNVRGTILVLGPWQKSQLTDTWRSISSGVATILDGTTFIDVTHGLYRTPVVSDITVTPMGNPTADPGHIWVDTVGNTTFRMNCRVDPGADLDLAWKAEII